MECDTVDEADQEERPVGATFGDLDIAAVVDGQEDVRCFAKVR